MRDYNFTLKVSDILRNPSTKDTVVFDKKFSSRIPNLTEEGITCTVHLQGLNHDEIAVTCTDCTAQVFATCDYCGTEFIKTLYADEVSAKVTRIKNILPEEQIEDLTLDPKNETVDLEEFITNSLQLANSVVNMCTTCEQKLSEQDDEIPLINTVTWKS